jgi:hypothetical protein
MIERILNADEANDDADEEGFSETLPEYLLKNISLKILL